MTSATSSTRREAPLGPDWPALGGRIALVLAAAACAAAGVSTFVTAPLSLLAFLLVFEAVTARSSHGPLDALVLTVGGLLVGAVLVGLLLDVVPGGIDRTSWAVAAGVCETAVVVWARPRGFRIPRPHFDPNPYVAGLGLVLIGLVLATVAEDHAGLSPVALSATPAPAVGTADPAGSTGTTRAEMITVTSSTSSGPMTLFVQGADGTQALAADFTVRAHKPEVVPLVVATGQRVTVRLVQGTAASDPTLRTLILVGA